MRAFHPDFAWTLLMSAMFLANKLLWLQEFLKGFLAHAVRLIDPDEVVVRSQEMRVKTDGYPQLLPVTNHGP